MVLKVYFLLFVFCFLQQQCNCMNNCPCKTSDLCQPVTAKYSKELVVFGDAKEDHWKKWNWTSITNVILTSLGNISELYCFAHTKKVRVTVMVGMSHEDFQNLPNKDFRQQLISSWINELTKYNLDGLNLDIEGAAVNKEIINGISALSQDTYNTLKQMNPNYLVTFDVYYSPYLADCISFLCYNYSAIATTSDYLIAMDYDATLDLLVANSNSALYLLEQAYDQYINELHIPAQHMVMAVPWYGYDYTCAKFFNNSGGDVCLIAGGKSTQSSFAAISAEFVNNIDGLKYWPQAKTPYFTVKINGDYHQFQFDNVVSLTYKYQLAERLGLGGLSMFQASGVDYDSSSPQVQQQTKEMWNAVTECMLKLNAK